MGKNRGITLIALIITIIVLLILAGVTIAVLFSRNGIIYRTNQAKLYTEVSTIKEGIELDTIFEEKKLGTKIGMRNGRKMGSSSIYGHYEMAWY